MSAAEQPLKILVLAKNSKPTVIQEMIDQLDKIADTFHGINIFLSAKYKPVCERVKVEKIGAWLCDHTHIEENFSQIQLIIIDDLSAVDVDFLLSMMMRRVPVLVEVGEVSILKDLLIPNRTVMGYSRNNLVQLPMQVISFLRNLKGLKQILTQAQLLAFEEKAQTGDNLLILKDAAVVGMSGAELQSKHDKEHQGQQGKKKVFKPGGPQVPRPRKDRQKQSPTGGGKVAREKTEAKIEETSVSEIDNIDTSPTLRPEREEAQDSLLQRLLNIPRLAREHFMKKGEMKGELEISLEGKVEHGEYVIEPVSNQQKSSESDLTAAPRDEQGIESALKLQDDTVSELAGGRVSSPNPSTAEAESTSKVNSDSTIRAEGIASELASESQNGLGSISQEGAAASQQESAQPEHSPITQKPTMLKELTHQQTSESTSILENERTSESAQQNVSDLATSPSETPEVEAEAEVAIPQTDPTPDSSPAPRTVAPTPKPFPPRYSARKRTRQRIRQSASKNPHHKRERWQPAVDLVIISYNTLGFLKECIRSIQTTTDYPYRIIVVDNGSTDGSVEYVQRYAGIQLIANRENRGYAKACNQGIMAGQSEFVVILNTDVQFSSGWLRKMIELAKNDPTIGVIGPKMVNNKGQIVGAGVTELDTCCGSRGWMEPDGMGVYTEIEDCYSVGGACYLIRRDAIEKVGLFDENYFFYFEETDLSLRMLEHGYRVVYDPEVRIIHHHEGTLKKAKQFERTKRNQYFLQSQQRFTKKWISVIHGASTRNQSKDIVVFGLIPWNFRYQRPQQILSRLAKEGYRILYINNFCYPGGRLETVAPNLHVFSPDGDGIFYTMARSSWYRQRVIDSINRQMERLQITHPILWVDAPYWEGVIHHFDRQFVVYNCMDAYEDFADLRKYCPNLTQMEKDLCYAADVIFASSKHLQIKLQKLARDVHLIPNGADCEHFALKGNLKVPADLKSIPRPIMGYYGAIAEWLDLDLIEYAAQKLPTYSFVLIGHTTVNVEKLKSLPNVYFLGEKAYRELPGYAQEFQAAMIPFKKNELTLATNPVKLYEYLAAGKPVVSVDLPEIQAFASVVQIANNPEEFVNHLAEVQSQESDLVRKKRQDAVKGEDWNDRVADIMRILSKEQEESRGKGLFVTLKEQQRKEGEV